MKNGWTKEAVHFMFEHYPPRSKVIFINEPFLVAKLEKGRVESPNRMENAKVIYEANCSSLTSIPNFCPWE
jgi:hypothetical protein